MANGNLGNGENEGVRSKNHAIHRMGDSLMGGEPVEVMAGGEDLTDLCWIIEELFLR